MKLVKFGDDKVTVKAKEMLEKIYAQKTLGLSGVIEFDQDDEEFETLSTIMHHADNMCGCVIRLGSVIERVTEHKLGSGHFLVYIP